MGKRIITILLILTLLCAAGLLVKTEYSKWRAAQPDALRTQVYEELTQAFPEFLEKHGMRRIRFHDLRHPYVKHTTKNNLCKSRKPEPCFWL